MRFCPIASSSSGNAYIVEHDGVALLIDCGVPYKRLSSFNFDAVLITHSHTDHVSGLKPLLKHREVPIYANLMTAETIMHDYDIAADRFVCFENGQTFQISSFSISPFSIPHDTSDPVGYLIKSPDATYFHGTDIGTPLDCIGLKLAEADIATLESNHDLELLRTCQRPACVIQRIMGQRGHLSNDQAAELVRRFASPRLKALNLAHLSHQCNSPHLAENAMREALRAIGREDIKLTILD